MPTPTVRKIVHLRWKQRLGPVEIGDRLATVSSTVHAAVVRCRLNRLTHIDRATGEPIRRYEHDKPGDLIHVDVKKLGSIPTVADGATSANSRATRTAPRPRPAPAERNKNYQPPIGTCYLHTVIDDHSRVAYVEAHDDENKETANGSCHKSRPVARHLHLDHRKEDTTLPPADEKEDRALPSHTG